MRTVSIYCYINRNFKVASACRLAFLYTKIFDVSLFIKQHHIHLSNYKVSNLNTRIMVIGNIGGATNTQTRNDIDK